jgi:hypothetical protein
MPYRHELEAGIEVDFMVSLPSVLAVTGNPVASNPSLLRIAL